MTIKHEEAVMLDCYDAGLLSDFGGGNVEWWQDYIRAELARAHDHYSEQLAALIAEVRSQNAPTDGPAMVLRKCNECSGEGYFIGSKNRRIDCERCNGNGTLYANRARLEEGK